MVTMIVRGVPEDLRNRLKAAAALQGQTMQGFILEALQVAVAKTKKGG